MNQIEQMSEEEIIRSIDFFLQFMKMDISNIIMKKTNVKTGNSKFTIR